MILLCLISFVTEEEINNSVKAGDLETLKILINTRLDPNPVVYEYSWAKFTVLHRAAYYGQLDIIIWYKDVLGLSDINPKDYKGNTPLYWATRKGKLDVVKYYVQNGYYASSKIFS